MHSLFPSTIALCNISEERWTGTKWVQCYRRCVTLDVFKYTSAYEPLKNWNELLFRVTRITQSLAWDKRQSFSALHFKIQFFQQPATTDIHREELQLNTAEHCRWVSVVYFWGSLPPFSSYFASSLRLLCMVSKTLTPFFINRAMHSYKGEYINCMRS